MVSWNIGCYCFFALISVFSLPFVFVLFIGKVDSSVLLVESNVFFMFVSRLIGKRSASMYNVVAENNDNDDDCDRALDGGLHQVESE